MSSAATFYSAIVFLVIVLLLTLDINKKIMSEDNSHDSVRTTQMSTISESINIGDLLVNGKLSMNQSIALENWIHNFKQNCDLNLTYKIDIIGIHEEPPAIAVRVRGYSNMAIMNVPDNLIVNYENLIIIDEPMEEAK